MKRIASVIIVLAVLFVTGIVAYRAGVAHRTRWMKPHKAYVGGDSEAAIQADQIVVELDDGKKLTLDLRSGPDSVTVYAGLPWPDGRDDPMTHTLNIMPAAGNVIHLSVQSHWKMTPKERKAFEKNGDEFRKEVYQQLKTPNRVAGRVSPPGSHTTVHAGPHTAVPASGSTREPIPSE